MYDLATCEPHNSIIHGGNDNDHFLVIYEYSLDEFYDSNLWKSETSFYFKKIRNKPHNHIRNYAKLIRNISTKMQLVEIFRENGLYTCVLHTYKINILKRRWKKKYYCL
jgi:hypothetical protein